MVDYVSGGFVRKAVTEISGLFHLIGEDVVVLADGNVVSGRTINSIGKLSPDLDRKASKVHVGKRFISDVETLDVEAPEGTIQGLKIKINSVTIRLDRSRGVLVGPSPNKLRQMKFREFEKLSSPTDLFTEEKKITLDSAWDVNGRVFIRQPFPLPMTVLAIIPNLDIGG